MHGSRTVILVGVALQIWPRIGIVTDENCHRLMLAILLLAAEKNKATFIAPVGIGIALFVAEMWGVGYTGGSLNPARSFGPSVADRQFNGYGEPPRAFLVLCLSILLRSEWRISGW